MTQLLWKKTTDIGIGVAMSSDKMYYIVVNYNPPGNVPHEYKDYLPPFTSEVVLETSLKLQIITSSLPGVGVSSYIVNVITKLPGWESTLHGEGQSHVLVESLINKAKLEE